MDYRRGGANSGDDTMKLKKKGWKGVEEMAVAKMERRQQLARLPFEEKISILVRLQSAARGINMASGRKCHEIWRLGE
jgi:hypothetical protein